MSVDGLDITERADRLSRRRTRFLLWQCFIFVIWQAQYFTWGRTDAEPAPTVQALKVSAWIAWAALMLILIWVDGGLFRSREVRRLMNDEVNRANRQGGQVWGFWAAMLAAFAVYAVAMVQPVSVHDTIHAVLTAAIAVAFGHMSGWSAAPNVAGEARLGNRLKEARQAAALTQAELALRVGVSRKTINTVENRIFVPSTLLALQIAAALDLSVEALFFVDR